jgi:hypothetical protein
LATARIVVTLVSTLAQVSSMGMERPARYQPLLAGCLLPLGLNRRVWLPAPVIDLDAILICAVPSRIEDQWQPQHEGRRRLKSAASAT